jgi:nitrite reductase/ring-hydroxylating ferredoxin subunit
MERFDLGPLSDLELHAVRFVRYDGPPPRRSILVVRSVEGVRAYWNVCRHLPIPLDAGAGRLPTSPRPNELVCATHGARYRMEDGLCVGGPCTGALLDEIEVEIDAAADRLWARI